MCSRKYENVKVETQRMWNVKNKSDTRKNRRTSHCAHTTGSTNVKVRSV